eukprot:543812-Rhodomonas_salina.2
MPLVSQTIFASSDTDRSPARASSETDMQVCWQEERRELRALIVVHEGLGALVEWMLQRE